jgi:hypothetical protein
MSLSDSSELSSAPPSDDEGPLQLAKQDGILKFVVKTRADSPAEAEEDSTPPRKRAPSPPHEYVLADNPDIAVSNVFAFNAFEAT